VVGLGKALRIGGGAALAGNITLGGIIFAILGAIILLFIWGLVARRTA
jgi:uncharacterized membrane protein YeaQ/YmgE (transglycosylase-associated protein family)